MGYRYLLFYKPYNVLSQFSDDRPNNPKGAGASLAGHRTAESLATPPQTLKDYIPVRGVYPVGRLDRDSEGLMLLTNHGRLQNRLSHPRFAHPRTYWCQVEGIPEEHALNRLRQGVIVKGHRTRRANIRRLDAGVNLPPRHPPIRYRKSVPTSWLELILTEGKNRQVRRMTAAVGHPTLRLVRVAIAHLSLESLKPGQWRELTPRESQDLLRLCSDR